MITCETKALQRLTLREIEDLKKLTLYPCGSMKPKLVELVGNRHDKRDPASTLSRVIIVRDNEVIVGWGLYFPNTYKTYARVGAEPTYKYYNTNAYFFVHKDHRRRGIGRMIADKIIRRDKGVCMHPWGADRNPSRRFFENVEQVMRAA